MYGGEGEGGTGTWISKYYCGTWGVLLVLFKLINCDYMKCETHLFFCFCFFNVTSFLNVFKLTAFEIIIFIAVVITVVLGVYYYCCLC